MSLSCSQQMGIILVPQSLPLAIPGTVTIRIGMFKDTTVIVIITMFDLLGVVDQNISGDPTWATPPTAETGYIFAAAIFWVFCFGMSRYSQYMERRLDTGHKR